MGKLSFGEKLGYGSASIGDAAVYTFICSFLMFFLTTVAGIEPAAAGAISLLASVWNAILSPVIGYCSDHSRSRMGRRRSYLLRFSMPLFAVTILLFVALDISYGIRVIYYGVMTLAFWTCYTGFLIPYYALGAEYTDDYNERTILRSYSSFLNMVGICLTMTIPTSLVKLLESIGFSEGTAWTIIASIISAVTFISILITIKESKGKDIPLESNGSAEDKVSWVKMIREYVEVFSMKPARIALLTSVFYLTSYAIMISDLMYFLTYNMGYTGMKSSAALLARCLIGMALIAPTTLLCQRTDKRKALIIVFIVGAAGVSIMRLIGVHGVATLGILLVFIAVCTVLYWQIMPAIIYDLCEYDEYINHKRREGVIVSLQGLVESVAAGIGSQLLGIILQLAKFDGSADLQGADTCNWIFHCVTIVPAILIIFAAIAIYKYPITREMFDQIKQKIKERNEQEDVLHI